jgi:hypothetical protein
MGDASGDNFPEQCEDHHQGKQAAEKHTKKQERRCGFSDCIEFYDPPIAGQDACGE